MAEKPLRIRPTLDLSYGLKVLEAVGRKTLCQRYIEAGVDMIVGREPGARNMEPTEERLKRHGVGGRWGVDPRDMELQGIRYLSHMTVRPGWHYEVDGKWFYQLHCECGAFTVLTAKEVFAREELGLGCAGFNCMIGSFEAQLYFRPIRSLQFQLAQIESYRPGWMSPQWIGKSRLEVAQQIFKQSQLIDSDGKYRFWIVGIRKATDMLGDTLETRYTPASGLFPHGKVFIKLEEELIELREFAEFYQLDWPQVLQARLRLDDNELADYLLGGMS